MAKSALVRNRIRRGQCGQGLYHGWILCAFKKENATNPGCWAFGANKTPRRLSVCSSDSHQTGPQVKGTQRKSTRLGPRWGEATPKAGDDPENKLKHGWWVKKKITNRFVVICSRITNSPPIVPPHPLASCRRSTSIQRVPAGSTCPATVSSVARIRNGTASWALSSVPLAELFQIRPKLRSHPM